jgi:RNA polymerase sigma-70 factor, ECF subfamily
MLERRHISGPSGVVLMYAGVMLASENHERHTLRMTGLSLSATVPDTSDQALLQRVRHGDERAFEELFVRHYAGVYGIVLRVTGSPEESEEIVGDVFLKLHRQPLAESDQANVRGWLYTVATRAALNAIRARRRRVGWLRRLAGRADAGEQTDDPLAIVTARDEARHVRECLRSLPERQGTVLILRSSGLSYAEIAEILGVTTGSVGTILARAERAFKARVVASPELLGGSDD